MITKAKKTLADLAAVHDRKIVVPNRIRAALEALKASGDDYAYEMDFCSLLKPAISHADLAKYRPQFEEFWADLPTLSFKGGSSAKRVWFATKALCTKWKENSSG